MHSHTAVIYGIDYMGERPLESENGPPYAIKVPPVDVWAMFAVKGEPMLAENDR